MWGGNGSAGLAKQRIGWMQKGIRSDNEKSLPESGRLFKCVFTDVIRFPQFPLQR